MNQKQFLNIPGMKPQTSRQETYGRDGKNLYARDGFSLVEITLALGVFSFCFIAVLGLLPLGINTNRDTIEQTQAAGIARAVQADFATTASGVAVSPRFSLRLPTDNSASATPQTVFFG